MLAAPLAAIGAIMLLVLGGSVVLAPVRLGQDQERHAFDLQGQVQSQRDKKETVRGFVNLYKEGERLLASIAGGNFRADMCDTAKEMWRVKVTQFYRSIGKEGRAATWVSDAETLASPRYMAGTGKLIEGDLGRVCSELMLMLRSLERDVEFV